jgi:hypothetical protein
MFRLLPLCILFVVAITGCGPSQAELDATIDLDLAVKKSDIEGIYKSASKLKAIGASPSKYESELEKSSNVINEFNDMEAALSDHNHEKVLVLADVVLNSYPKNPKATKYFRESGLLFKNLFSAKALVSGIYDSEKDEFQKVKNENGDENIDIGKIAKDLSDARELLKRARALDGYYVDSINLDESIKSSMYTIMMLAVLAQGTEYETINPFIIKKLAERYDTINEFITKYKYSLQNAYSAVVDDDSNAKLLDILDNSTEKMATALSKLKALVTEDTQEIYDWLSDMNQWMRNDVGAIINPTGTMNKWKEDLLAYKKNYDAKLNQYNLIQPESNSLKENITNFSQVILKIKVTKNPERTKKLIEKRADLLQA